MKTVHSTTKPGWYDTEEIATEKWNQIKATGAVDDSSGHKVTYSQTGPTFHDSELTTLQKILQHLN